MPSIVSYSLKELRWRWTPLVELKHSPKPPSQISGEGRGGNTEGMDRKERKEREGKGERRTAEGMRGGREGREGKEKREEEASTSTMKSWIGHWTQIPKTTHSAQYKIRNYTQLALCTDVLFSSISMHHCWVRANTYTLVKIDSVLWFPFSARHCWLGDRKGIRPVKSWDLGCWQWQVDLSFARLIAPVVTIISIILSFSKIQNADILVPANPGPPRKWLLERTERDSTGREYWQNLEPYGQPNPQVVNWLLW